MVYIDKNTLSAFGLPLLDLTTFANHGYLFKVTRDSDGQTDTEYIIPTVTSEDARFTKFSITSTLKAGQYRYEVFEFDADDETPINDTGLTSLCVGILKVIETETNSIYL